MNHMIDGNQSCHPTVTPANELLCSGLSPFYLALRSKVVSISTFSLPFLDSACVKQMVRMFTFMLN